MASLKTAFMVLLLLGVLSAFNVDTYIYLTEKNVTVSYTNFTLDGDNYSLVTLNGANTFLLKNDEALRNTSDIESAMHDYYAQQYYPSDDEIANLTALIKKFNDSRNNGYDFKNKEEYICRNDVFLNDKMTIFGTPAQLALYGTPVICTNSSCTTRVECRNNYSCTRLASVLVSAYCENLNLCSGTDALKFVTDFSMASYDMDGILGNYTAMLGNLSQDNVAATLDYIKSTTATLKADSLKVESTPFRTPRLNDSADRAACTGVCYATCPSLDLDQAATDQIGALATTLSNKVAPLKNYQIYASQLASASAARFDYAKIESAEAYYTDLFHGLNASGTQAIVLGQQARSHVSNMTLNANLDQLMALQASIPEDLANRNFTTTDSDMAAYRNSTAVVMNISLSLLGEYNSTLNAKNTADSLLLMLQTKDNLDPSALETFGILQNRTADLDASFKDGYTVDQLRTLRLKYVNVTGDAQDLLTSENEVPAAKAVVLFRGFARRVNAGISKFAVATKLGDTQSIVSNPLLSFGSFSTIVFLSLTALSLLFFLYIFVSVSLDVPQSKFILGAAFLCTLVIFLGFCIFLYLFLDKTSVAATFTEFLSDFSSRNSTSIVLDLRNVSYSDAQSMVSCADSLSGVFASDNKTWDIYTVTPSSCIEKQQAGGNVSMTVDACLASAANQSSAFMLSYSSKNQPPKFSIIYKSEADISANSDYYKSCPLVALFG